MNKRNIYLVPDLTTKEIISYFSELGITISPADILKPSVAVTQAIYDSIIEFFEGGSAPDGDESLQVIRQVQRIGSFLCKIGISNFTIRDLSPDSRRFIQILSTICNFGMFRDNKRQVYEQTSKMVDNNFLIKKDLELQLNKIKLEIDQVQNKLEENSKIKDALEKETLVLENEFKEFYKYQKDKMNDVSRLKSEKIEIGDKLCSSQLLEHNLKQEITCLKTQIVSDPSKLLELVEEMRSLIEKEKEAIRAIEKTVQDNNNKMNKLCKLGDQIQSINAIANELDLVEEKIEKYEQDIVISESKLKNWDSNINALKIRINHIERQISHLESKIFNLQSRDKKVSEEISAKIAALQKKYDGVNLEREQMHEKARKNNKMIQGIMYESARRSSEHERDSSEVAGLLVSLSSQIDSYFNGLKDVL